MQRVALAGFGSIAEHGHVPAWLRLPDTEVVAVADLSSERLAVARGVLPYARLYSDPFDLIRDERIDVLDICTPPGTHADLIVKACTLGVPTIVSEKPLVLGAREFDRIATARAATNTRIASINNWVYSDMNRLVTGTIREGTIGQIERVDIAIGRSDIALGNTGWNPRWRISPTHAGGGIVLDHGWHQLYLILGWMAADPLEVAATIQTIDKRHHPVEDEAIIELSFPAGIVRIELSWVAEGRTNVSIIRGSQGSIEALDDCIVVTTGATRRRLPYASRLSQSSYHPDWFEQTFRYNVAVADSTAADRNFREAGMVVNIIDAIYRSARMGGHPVRPRRRAPEGTHVDISGRTAAG